MDMNSDFDRLLFFEHARKAAEADYAKNPLDAENLTRWGGALLELSQFHNVNESKKMLQGKKMIVSTSPTRRGRAIFIGGQSCGPYLITWVSMISQGPGLEISKKDEDHLWRCHVGSYKYTHVTWPLSQPGLAIGRCTYLVEPSSVASKPQMPTESCGIVYAPDLHTEIHKQGFAQQAMGTGPSTSTSSTAKTEKKKKSSDLKYDIFGWIILAVGIFAWVGFGKSHVPPPPPT
ncbi:Mitochondrial import receptor subunit like [Actinidia chinensis var. chinensis]|uniref:Mitochondrial import receptor subunit like n=1 Tax=Actinidia chinensis var. chinensis TaxID=1590841 RepID=A0A2R6RK06_ACTCC|nr:Mitochondrial import receptor subunit like [Actinidia chinensis var. chinensis]